MATNILSIGQSALAAAQAAIATTSHNISNATVAGYNRQVVVQSSAGAINYGYGYVGQGTQISDISRVYNDFTNKQVLASQTAASSLTAYSAQISSIDNLLADSSAGLTTSLQSFFSSLSDLSAHPNADASRQAVLSSAQTLTNTFQSLNDQMATSRANVNSQITSNVTTINSYATQIAQLNASIATAQGTGSASPNDLLDQRDQIIANLNKIVKVSTVPQDNGSLSVFIGTGQPLVMGESASTLTAVASVDDPNKLQVAYQTGSRTVTIPDGAFTGGTLGGILDYRTNTLDTAQNSLGRIAIAMAQAFNAQSALGQDQNGQPGTDFFKVADPQVIAKSTNSGGTLTAKVTDASALTTSDYKMTFDGTNFTITRNSDGIKTTFAAPTSSPTTFSQVVDGVTFSGDAATMQAGDSFTVKPTINGASSIALALTSTQQIAAAAPIITAATAVNSLNDKAATANTGTGVISAGTVDSATFVPGTSMSYAYDSGANTLTLTQSPSSAGAVTVTLPDGTVNNYAAGAAIPFTAGATVATGGTSFILSGAPANGDTFTMAPTTANQGTAAISGGTIDKTYLAAPLTSPSTFLFSSTGNQLTLKPAAAVTVTDANGIVTNYASGAPIAYSPGASYSTGGVSFTLTGTPKDGDSFTIAPNIDGVTDNRNSQLLSAIQTSNTIGKTTLQGSYSQLVSFVGNKTNEVNVLQTSETTRLKLITDQQASESGVNQDEELAKLIQYQQAYQAGAKIIQAASDMLNVLFTLGG